MIRTIVVAAILFLLFGADANAAWPNVWITTVVVLVLPFVFQTLSLHRVNTEIADLQPTVAQTEALRRGISGASLKVMQRMSAQPFAVSRLLELIEWAGPPAEEVPVAATPATPAEPAEPAAKSPTLAA